jgi:NADPH-dependent 7-cyano-7-deazaguanine reductase QueF
MTFCPVNRLPDFVYVYVTFPAEEFVELYNVRKQIRAAIKGRCEFMETLAKDLLTHFDAALQVEFVLMTGRHRIVLQREK